MNPLTLMRLYTHDKEKSSFFLKRNGLPWILVRESGDALLVFVLRERGKASNFKTPQSSACIVDRLVGKEMNEEIAAGEAEYPLPQYTLPAAVEKDRPALRILVPE